MSTLLFLLDIDASTLDNVQTTNMTVIGRTWDVQTNIYNIA